MNISYEKNILLNIIGRQTDMGKTAVMKVVFMLQRVKKVDVKYDFTIYTYGPYSADVTEEVDALISEGLVQYKMYPYQNYIGYQLNLSEEGKQAMQSPENEAVKAIEEILAFSKGKSAKDLELFSTIIYVDNFSSKNAQKKDADSIISEVCEIKPYFSKETIDAAYKTLREIHYISA